MRHAGFTGCKSEFVLFRFDITSWFRLIFVMSFHSQHDSLELFLEWIIPLFPNAVVSFPGTHIPGAMQTRRSKLTSLVLKSKQETQILAVTADQGRPPWPLKWLSTSLLFSSNLGTGSIWQLPKPKHEQIEDLILYHRMHVHK